MIRIAGDDYPAEVVKSRFLKDILKLVNALILNTKGEGEKSSEDFWVKAERLYYSALIGYIWYEAEPEERNFITLLDLINASEAREDDEEFQSPVDLLFAKLEKEHPDHFAVKQYRKFKMAAGKTLKSILISCGARLAPFDIAELRDLMAEDELELDTLGDRKSALFVILSDTDSTFNFVAALMYSQLFNLLCDKADDFYGGRLPVHVRCLLDEFANIGQIPNFEKLIATIRSREISAAIILQSQSQLKTIYKDAADTIVGNCDSTLFLGGKEKSTLKEISELLGKETIDSFNQSENRGSQVSHGLTYQKLGKVGEIAGEVGMTPSAWNSGIFNMVRNLSETVIVPIASIVLTFVMCYELIQLIIEKNLDCYDIYPDIHDHDDLGRYYIEELDAMQVPEHLRNYIDYEAYGRDVALEEGGEFTDLGYVRDTGSSFHEYYDGEHGSIPEEYRVMTFQDAEELTEEEKSEWAMDIAYDMDEFFRQHDPQYAAEHPEEHAAKEEIYENLMAGRISALDEKLAALGQTQEDYLPSEIEKFKDATGYEEFLDFDPAVIKAALEDPDKSHVDEMLAFAEQAGREYEAELAGQTPAPSPDDRETGETVRTPRGTFYVTDMSREQMEAAGYGLHHQSDDGKYLIMGNGARAFAVLAEQPEKDNPLRTAEMTLEDDYGMIDGVINNGRKGEELEAAKAEAARTSPEKRPSIRERLAEAKKECGERKPPDKAHQKKSPERDL
ncbi:type IV secretory system conjugative DNA transfer family protein [Ruthenibacterium lactatiformans]|nr:type IV secretory system conjugative DNA transfer family protein [Ruthenibacterium lactatiformans]